jgi:hypothetical protein
MMRQAAVGIVVVMIVFLACLGWTNAEGEVRAQQVPPAVKPLVLSDGLIALSSDTADGHQQVAVIESKTRVMSVYHIDHKSGTITLKSVRNLAADLEMDEYNTEKPLPQEIRAILNKR